MQRGAACFGHPRELAHGAWGSREPRPTICRSGALPTARSHTQRWGSNTAVIIHLTDGKTEATWPSKSSGCQDSPARGCLGSGGPSSPLK